MEFFYYNNPYGSPDWRGVLVKDNGSVYFEEWHPTNPRYIGKRPLFPGGLSTAWLPAPSLWGALLLALG